MNIQEIIVIAIVIGAALYLIKKLRNKSKGDTCGACDKK
jgi:hypothetical protein